MTYEVRVDCPHCRVEGARLETWDQEASACRLGVPATVSCRLCGHAAEGRAGGVESPAPGDGCPACGAAVDDAVREAHRCPFCGAHARLDETAAARRIGTRDDLERALAAWAREEGLVTPEDILEAYFVLPSTVEVFDAMRRGESVETTFDVADYLFSSGPSAGGAAAEPAVMREPKEEAPITERNPGASVRRVGGPREELLALASVAAADGDANADDQAALKRAAERRALPALGPEDVRVWRPNELDPPPTLVDRERVLEEMFQLAWADGQMDESELRVIRDFALAWGIDSQRLRDWVEMYTFADANRFERWMRRISGFLFPPR